MRGTFVVKRKVVGAGPSVRFEVYESMGLIAGLTWAPWFVTYDEGEATRYAEEATKIRSEYGRIELAGRYWCEISPRSGSFGPQFNIYKSAGFLGLGSDLIHSTHSLDRAQAWAERATQLTAA